MTDTPAAHAPSMLGGDWHRHGPLIEHSHLRGSFAHAHHPATGDRMPLPADARENLGRLVRDTWVAWAREQPDVKPSWLVDWSDLDDGQREVDMRIGQAVAAAATAEADGEYRHASLIIACLVRRLGGHVTLDPAELADEPAAMSTVGTASGFEIKVIE